jgi:hypothetical protein
MEAPEVTSDANLEDDRRYRCMVLLNRTDRPGVFTWHCPRCTMPVVELTNAEFVAITDTMDMDSGKQSGIGVRCDGRYQGKGCRIWFYFSLNEAKKS